MAGAKKAKPRGWVFKREGGKREIGFAEPKEYKNADDAVRDFGRSYEHDFEVWFRDSKGVLHSVADESTPEDFD